MYDKTTTELLHTKKTRMKVLFWEQEIMYFRWKSAENVGIRCNPHQPHGPNKNPYSCLRVISTLMWVPHFFIPPRLRAGAELRTNWLTSKRHVTIHVAYLSRWTSKSLSPWKLTPSSYTTAAVQNDLSGMTARQKYCSITVAVEDVQNY
jgi:hypothetical protein